MVGGWLTVGRLAGRWLAGGWWLVGGLGASMHGVREGRTDRAEKQLVKGRKGPAVAGLPPRRQRFRARYRYLCPPPIGWAVGG